MRARSHDLFVADVDGDSVMEVITGGFMYHKYNGSRLNMEAPLKMWSWNGQNLTLEKSHSTFPYAYADCVLFIKDGRIVSQKEAEY